MKNYTLPEGERNQIINFLENCTVPSNVGATLFQFAVYLKNLKPIDEEKTKPIEPSPQGTDKGSK